MIQGNGSSILIGNGISRLLDGFSWEEFLSILLGQEDIFKDACPKPLQTDLLSDNYAQFILLEKKLFPRIDLDSDKTRLIESLISLGFTNFLTTNYSYELETIGLRNEVSDKVIEKKSKHTKAVVRAEPKYLISTFNQISTKTGINMNVWHIHGEKRKSHSIVLGYDQYIRLSSRIVEYCNKHYGKFRSAPIPEEYRSWIDCFIFDDLHVLGFGFDFSELDLWWLLLKKNKASNRGKTFYYSKEESFLDEYESLINEKLREAGVEICYVKTTKNQGKIDYMSFYKEAIKEINNKMNLAIKNTKE